MMIWWRALRTWSNPGWFLPQGCLNGSHFNCERMSDGRERAKSTPWGRGPDQRFSWVRDRHHIREQANEIHRTMSQFQKHYGCGPMKSNSLITRVFQLHPQYYKSGKAFAQVFPLLTHLLIPFHLFNVHSATVLGIWLLRHPDHE